MINVNKQLILEQGNYLVRTLMPSGEIINTSVAVLDGKENFAHIRSKDPRFEFQDHSLESNSLYDVF